MKLFLYLFLFLGILGVVAFGFFTMTTPNIQQTAIHKELDTKDAFGSINLSPMPSGHDTPLSAPPLTEE